MEGCHWDGVKEDEGGQSGRENWAACVGGGRVRDGPVCQYISSFLSNRIYIRWQHIVQHVPDMATCIFANGECGDLLFLSIYYLYVPQYM